MRLCEAAFGTLFTYDGALFHSAAYQGEPGYGDWLRQASPFRPERAVTFQRILRGADIVHIADVLEDDAYRGNEPDARAAVEISGMRTLITVPLRKEDVLLGAITVYRQEVRPFTDKQIALLQNFAAQAVIELLALYRAPGGRGDDQVAITVVDFEQELGATRHPAAGLERNDGAVADNPAHRELIGRSHRDLTLGVGHDPIALAD